tara:strand:+ start:174 stop:386 length:213 start_codon:yes stop_codon:yes gene_type:complete
LVKQSHLVDGFWLDALSFFEDRPDSASIDIGRGQIVDALMILLCVVALDEVVDIGLQSGAAPSEVAHPLR